MDTTVPVYCPNCKTELQLLIVPISKGYTYTISAESEKEQEERWANEEKLRQLEKEAEQLRNKLRR